LAGRIPPQFIDDLLNRVDIVDVINRRVPLKKTGKEHQARCPFHDEKTPSFTVSSEKQFYHCFGCGAHGSAIGFLMDYDNLNFVEAIEELADMAGMEVPRESGFQQGPNLQPLYALLQQAAAFYQQQLRKHPQASRAVEYLKQRGLSGEIAARFGIGYAPPGWDNLLKAMGSTPQDLVQLRETGLITEQEGKRYDRFRDRIMFPIRDPRGRVIGFGGRVLEKEASPKYLNSPETPVFHKGRELYGLHEAKQQTRNLERLLVVEGYMDVVALAQFGINNAVATLGTATSTDHLELIFRSCSEVVFSFDGDRAGRDAAWKALQTALPVMRDGREARFLFLPEGEDPDSLVRKVGADNFKQRIASAMPLSEWLFDQLSSRVDMSSIDGRVHLATLAKPLLEKLPQGLFRQMLFQHLEKLARMEQGTLRDSAPAPRKKTSSGYNAPQPTPIRMAIALLLDNPSLASLAAEVDNRWSQWSAPGISLLKQLIESASLQPSLNKAGLLEQWRDSPDFPHLNKLASYRFDLPGMDAAAEFKGALNKLNQQFLKATTKIPVNLRLSEVSEEERDELKKRYPGSNPHKEDEKDPE
jgi:DNA primase